MLVLYEMTGAFADLYEDYDAINNIVFNTDDKGNYIDDDGNVVDPEQFRENMRAAWFDTLDGMEQEIQAKAETVAVFIKNMNAEAELMKAEENRLKARRQAKEKAAERMKEYLISCLDTVKLTKIGGIRASMYIKNNPVSLNIVDESSFIDWAEKHDKDELLRYKAPEINKTAVKALIKSGEYIPYTELVQGRSIIIK